MIYLVFDNSGLRLKRLGILSVPCEKKDNYEYLFREARAKFNTKCLTLRLVRRK